MDDFVGADEVRDFILRRSGEDDRTQLTPVLFVRRYSVGSDEAIEARRLARKRIRERLKANA